MKATVRWVDGMQFVGEAGSGHSVVIDGPPELGGRDTGMRPMELMLLSVGACASVDVVHILRKARQPVQGCRVEVEATRADTDPKVFTAIHLCFVLRGRMLSEKHVARAVSLSAEKYCSASIMLGAAATITHSHRIEPDRPIDGCAEG